MIVGDNHARGCAAEVKQLLSSYFEVFGSINPGAGMKTIKDTASAKVQHLTKKDVVVLWGGSNDICILLTFCYIFTDMEAFITYVNKQSMQSICHSTSYS